MSAGIYNSLVSTKGPTRSVALKAKAPGVSLAPTKPDIDLSLPDHPQAALHEAVFYKPRGQVQLSQGERAALDHVAANYVIPDDFELDTTKFGPLSGVSYEERLLSAYRHALLPLRRGHTRVALCTGCAREGHWVTDCPAAFETGRGAAAKR